MNVLGASGRRLLDRCKSRFQARGGLGAIVLLAISAGLLGSAPLAVAATGSGYAASTYVSSFPFDPNSAVGPAGLGFDSGGSFYASDYAVGGLYRFPGGCASTCTADAAHQLASFNGPIGLAFGTTGLMYLAVRGDGAIYQINKTTGAVVRTVVSNPACFEAVAIDPVSGDLFWDGCQDGNIYRVSHPSTGSNLASTPYASLPAALDGLTFTSDGTLWAEDGGDIFMVSGTNSSAPGTVTDLGLAIGGADGVAAARNPSNPGHPPFLMVNSNDGTVYKVDLTWPASGPPTATVEPSNTVYFNGSRGDFVTVGADGCLYATQTDSIVKVTNANGSCSLASTVQPLVTTKTADSSTASAGGSDGYTITISNPHASATTLGNITDTLPAGFTYTTGSSSGATIADPVVSGQSLNWSGSFSVPAGGHISLHFDVTVSSTSGTFYNNAGGRSVAFPVTPTGNTAPVTIGAAHTLTVVKTGTGTGAVTDGAGSINCGSMCSAQYAEGTHVTLTATSDAGSTFTGWSGGGCSGTGTCTVTMNSDQTVTATFTKITPTLTVAKAGTGAGTVTDGAGNISCGSTCSASYTYGAQVTLTATADPGSIFTGWSGAGCSGNGTCAVTMNSDQTVTATFTAAQPLTTTKTADAPTVAAGAADGYTIKIANPNPQDEPLSSITDTLPAGFSYTKGSSSIVTSADPSISGQTLTWSGSFSVPAHGSVSLHFEVTVSSADGTYYNTAGGSSSAVAVTGTGPTAPVTVANGFGRPGTDGTVDSVAVSGSAIYMGGLFTSTSGVPGYNYIAENTGGQTTALGPGLNGQVNAIAVAGTSVYVGGAFTATSDGKTTLSNLAKWDGKVWSAVAGGVSAPVKALVIHNGVLYVGGSFSSVGSGTSAVSVHSVAALNLGTGSWSNVGGGVSGGVSAMAWNGVLGQLFVTGSFSGAGGHAAGAFASWDGTSWNTWSGGLSGPNPSGNAVAVDPASGAVYVGGFFSAGGGVSAGNLAELRGGTWSDAGDFTNAAGGSAAVNAVAVSGGKVYAGGSFDTVNGNPAAHLAVQSAGTWSQVGAGVNGVADAIVPMHGGMVVGGAFNNSGAIVVDHVAIWTGSAWATVGQGLQNGTGAGEVDALLSAGSGVYAAGSFTQAGATLANNVADWTGNRWLALGSGIAGSSSVAPRIRALAMIAGKLYAAGLFASAGGTPVSNIAMWDGSAWHALGNGLNGEVYALTVIGGNLYAGGNFTTADGISARGVAEYVPGSGWKAVGGNPVLGGIDALANLGNRYLLLGGGFSQVGSYANAHGFAVFDTHTTAFPTDISGYTFPGGVSGPSLSSGIYAIQVMPGTNGDVFLGGSFDRADVTPTSSGSAAGSLADWQAHPGGGGAPAWVIPTGVSGGGIFALAETTKTTAGAASPTTLYATGNFTQAGAQSAAGLASYAPSSDAWTALGTGLKVSGQLYGDCASAPVGCALAQNGTAGLYIGGGFLTEGGPPASGVGLWPGTAGLLP